MSVDTQPHNKTLKQFFSKTRFGGTQIETGHLKTTPLISIGVITLVSLESLHSFVWFLKRWGQYDGF